MMDDQQPVQKVHPASREILPDDPMDLHGVEVAGDARLMLRLLVEEYARLGWGAEQIMKLAQDPFYVAFHGLFQTFGPDRLRSEIDNVLARCGVTQIRTTESPTTAPREIVSLELPSDR